MTTVVISDVHGRTDWKKIIAQDSAADYYIFLGDYFDSFDISSNDQIENFKEIIEFKIRNPCKAILLTGNHDLHYFPYYVNRMEHYSGYQKTHGLHICQLLQESLSYLQMAFRQNDILFTHAGVTHAWLKDNGFDKSVEVEEFINSLFVHKPAAFRFVGTDPYGDSVQSSPVWVRPRSLMKNAFRFNDLRQVVGHTEYNNIKIVKNQYCFTDAPKSGKYLSITDGQFLINTLLHKN